MPIVCVQLDSAVAYIPAVAGPRSICQSKHVAGLRGAAGVPVRRGWSDRCIIRRLLAASLAHSRAPASRLLPSTVLPVPSAAAVNPLTTILSAVAAHCFGR